MTSWVDSILVEKGASSSLLADLLAFLRREYSDSVSVAEQEIKLMILVKEHLLVLTPPPADPTVASTGLPSQPFTSLTPSPVLSAEAYKYISRWEGVRYYSYPDPSRNGTRNIGLGHQILPTEKFNEPISDATSRALFAKDWLRFYNQVIQTIKIPLRGESIIALASLAYTIGHIPKSIAALVNARKIQEAVALWLQYTKAEDSRKILHTVPALVTRRREETALFLQGFR